MFERLRALLSSQKLSAKELTSSMRVFFFFQAEDGIRYRTVTGVQTCALPIYSSVIDTSLVIDSLHDQTTYYWRVRAKNTESNGEWAQTWKFTVSLTTISYEVRSEERRVGKDSRRGG